MVKPTPLEDVISPKAIAYKEVFTSSITIPLPYSEYMVFNYTAKSTLAPSPVAVIGCSTTKACYPCRPILDWIPTRLQGNPQVKSLLALISSPF